MFYKSGKKGAQFERGEERVCGWMVGGETGRLDWIEVVLMKDFDGHTKK